MHTVGQAFVTESEGQARDSVSTDDALIIVHGQQHGWTAVVAWHGSNVPGVAKSLPK